MSMEKQLSALDYMKINVEYNVLYFEVNTRRNTYQFIL